MVRLPVDVANAAKHIASTRAGDIAQVYDVDPTSRQTVALASSSVQAGFPSPADDHLEAALDFNDLLIETPAATFAVRIAGDSMIEVGIFAGDIAVVDRAKTPSNGDVVLAIVNGEFTVKRLRRSGGKITLVAENKDYDPIQIGNDDQLEIWGVIKRTIRMSL